MPPTQSATISALQPATLHYLQNSPNLSLHVFVSTFDYLWRQSRLQACVYVNFWPPVASKQATTNSTLQPLTTCAVPVASKQAAPFICFKLSLPACGMKTGVKAGRNRVPASSFLSKIGRKHWTSVPLIAPLATCSMTSGRRAFMCVNRWLLVASK